MKTPPPGMKRIVNLSKERKEVMPPALIEITNDFCGNILVIAGCIIAVEIAKFLTRELRKKKPFRHWDMWDIIGLLFFVAIFAVFMWSGFQLSSQASLFIFIYFALYCIVKLVIKWNKPKILAAKRQAYEREKEKEKRKIEEDNDDESDL